MSTFIDRRKRGPSFTEILEGLPDDLIVGSMCHCDDRYDDDEPDDVIDCPDHWEFFHDAEMGHDDKHVRRGRSLTEDQMRAIAALVEWAHATERDHG